MQEIKGVLPAVHSDALDKALRAALGAKLIGISTYGASSLVSLWLDDSVSVADIVTAQSIASAHDPVFLSLSKTSIKADGVDAATLTVLAPKPGAAPIVVTINGTDYPLTLTGNSASDTITATGAAYIQIRLKNSANRTTDTLNLTAI